MDIYWYNLCYKLKNQTWKHPKLLTYLALYKYFQNNINRLRMTFTGINKIRNAGWHLSYFGDVNTIMNKISNFSHQEKAVQEINTKQQIEYRMKNGLDLYHKDRGWRFERIPIEKNQNLPPLYKEYLQQFIM